jgi:exonuclease VII small subunit
MEISKGCTGGIEYKDPSFVQVSFSRMQGGGIKLYGSSIEHDSVIALRISQSSITRNLSTDWFHESTRPYIEVWLSPTQFSELLTTMNIGSGVPATLVQKEGERFSLPNLPTKAEEFKEEAKESIRKVLKTLENTNKMLEEQLSSGKPLSKKAQEKLKANILNIQNRIMDSMSFILGSFQEQMAKTVNEAKGEVDAFVQHTITKTGIEALKEKGQIKMIEEEENA